MADSLPDPNLSDFELLPNPDGPAPRRQRHGLWLLILLIVVLAVIAYVVVTTRQRASIPQAITTAPHPAETPKPLERPLGGDATPIALPPLGETDPIVRQLVRALTSNPQIAAWLATSDLIRNFVVVVSNVGDGRTPAPQLRVLRPPAMFRVVDRGGSLSIDPRSYQRYDRLADAAASVDPVGAARLYTVLKPRIEDAYRELGYPDAPFDGALERAFAVLLGTPQVTEPVRVVPMGVTYQYASADLARLSSAQRQLVRTGPRNEPMIQASLRAIAIALGIPAERLPMPRQVAGS